MKKSNFRRPETFPPTKINHFSIRNQIFDVPEAQTYEKFAGPLAQGVLDLEPGAITFFVYDPLTPQWTSGPQSTHTDDGYGLHWTTLKITETIMCAQPNWPDQISDMNQIDADILGKSPIPLRGSSQMDLGIHKFSYLFEKRISSEIYRMP